MTETAASPAAPSDVDLVGGVPAATTVAGVLEHVGDDAELAGIYLERERAAERPRTTLVDKLEAIAGPSAESVAIVLTGVSHAAKPGDVVSVDAERAAELQRSGLARLAGPDDAPASD